MPSRPSDQLALDEKTIEDAKLLAALEEREQRRTDVAERRAELRKVDEEVRVRVEDLDLAVDTAVRIGRFRITKTMTEARHVEFDSEAKERVSIRLADES